MKKNNSVLKNKEKQEKTITHVRINGIECHFLSAETYPYMDIEEVAGKGTGTRAVVLHLVQYKEDGALSIEDFGREINLELQYYRGWTYTMPDAVITTITNDPAAQAIIVRLRENNRR